LASSKRVKKDNISRTKLSEMSVRQTDLRVRLKYDNSNNSERACLDFAGNELVTVNKDIL
jgi:hypothetical protein